VERDDNGVSPWKPDKREEGVNGKGVLKVNGCCLRRWGEAAFERRRSRGRTRLHARGCGDGSSRTLAGTSRLRPAFKRVATERVEGADEGSVLGLKPGRVWPL
jgi:hypothetical protein